MMHYTARHSKLLRMDLRQSRSSTLLRRRKSEFSSTYPKTMRTRCFEEHIFGLWHESKMRRRNYPTDFPGASWASWRGGGRRATTSGQEAWTSWRLKPFQHATFDPKIAPTKLPRGMKWIFWCRNLSMSTIFKDIWWHTLLDRPCEDHCIQPRWKVHCYRKWGCLIVCVSCRGWVRMIGFLNAFLLLLLLLELRFGRMGFSSSGTWSRVKNSWPKQFRRWPRTTGGGMTPHQENLIQLI